MIQLGCTSRVANNSRRVSLTTLLLLLISLPAQLCVGQGLSSADTSIRRAVAFDQRSFIIHGKRELLFSGSIHYVRVPPSDWNTVFQMAKVSEFLPTGHAQA